MGVIEKQKRVQAYHGQIVSPGRPPSAWHEDRVRLWATIAAQIKCHLFVAQSLQAEAQLRRVIWSAEWTPAGRISLMQDIFRPDHGLPSARAQKWANAGIVATGILLLGGLGASALQGQQAQASNAQTVASYTPATTYTAPPEPTEVAFLGDSFTAGTGAPRNKRWTTLLSKEEGWLELNYGFGGTNYMTAGQVKGGRPYSERLTDLIISDPDIVIVSSAGNTLSVHQRPGMKETFETLREALPDARIIATSPYYRAQEFPDALIEFGEDVKTEVEAVGGEYLEIGHPLRHHPEGVSKDGIHPNSVGYRLIADAVGEAL